MSWYSLNIVGANIISNDNHIGAEIGQTSNDRVFEDTIGYVKMNLIDHKCGLTANCLASDFEIVIHVSKRALAAVERLLDDRICILLEGIDEPCLRTLSGSLDGILPEPAARLTPG